MPESHTINKQKTKYMYSTRNSHFRDKTGQNITMDDHNFELVEKVELWNVPINLGIMLRDRMNWTEEINCRNEAGNK